LVESPCFKISQGLVLEIVRGGDVACMLVDDIDSSKGILACTQRFIKRLRRVNIRKHDGMSAIGEAVIPEKISLIANCGRIKVGHSPERLELQMTLNSLSSSRVPTGQFKLPVPCLHRPVCHPRKPPTVAHVDNSRKSGDAVRNPATSVQIGEFTVCLRFQQVTLSNAGRCLCV